MVLPIATHFIRGYNKLQKYIFNCRTAVNIVPHGRRMVNVKIERITCFHIVQPLVDYVVFRKR